MKITQPKTYMTYRRLYPSEEILLSGPSLHRFFIFLVVSETPKNDIYHLESPIVTFRLSREYIWRIKKHKSKVNYRKKQNS